MNSAEQDESKAVPIGDEERIAALDVVRAIALLGVLLINLETDFRLPLARVDWVLEVVVAGKVGFVFYGYGLGLFGRLSSAEALPIGLTLYAAQIAASAAWLRRFRFGPAEWLWRSATYGRWQPWSRATRA